VTAIDRTLFRTAMAAFRPPARPSTAEWAEGVDADGRPNMRLTTEMAAQPGPLRLSAAQKAVLAAIDDPHTPFVVFMASSQVGKSTLLDAATLRNIAVAPVPMMLVHPTDAKATDYTRTRLDPLIAANANIRALVGRDASNVTKAGAGGNGLTYKSFPGGSLSIASSHKPEDLAARPIAFLELDEVDRFAKSAGKEGSPVELAIKRTRTFPRRKIVLTSTPTFRDASVIAEWFARGTRDLWNVPCPHCGVFFAPIFDHVKWTPGKPKTAYIECPECGGSINEAQRLRAAEMGCFVSTNPEPGYGVKSFHQNVLTSKFGTLADVVTEYENAKTSDKLRVFYNTVLGLPYDPGSETENDPDDLQSRAVEIGAPYPKDVQFVTAGVDVQGNRLELTYLAHCATRKLVLDHVIIGGDTTGGAVWDDLRRHLRMTFPITDGRDLRIAATFVDSGYLSSTVQAFALRHPNVFATFGRQGWERQPVRQGHRIEGTPKHVLILGIDNAKLSIAKALQADTEAPIVLPNHPHLGADYFEQLAAEKLEVKYTRSGHPVQTWTKDPTTRNEAFDCLVYAYLAASLVKSAPKSTTAKAPSIGELAARLQRDGQVAAPRAVSGDNMMRLQ
jgi:phage terminase large subunit GpA-like protein